MVIQTAPNILTTIDIPFTGLNAKSNRWEIKYSIKKTNLIEGVTSPVVTDRVISIFDTPETPILDEQGNQTGTTPATTDLTDFMASWNDLATLTEQSYQRVLAHEGIVEWSDDVITDIETDPEAETILPFMENIGELVAYPNRRSYNGGVYQVIEGKAHRTQANWTPDVATSLWNYLFDEDSDGEYQIWVQPQGAHDAYQVGAIVHFPTIDDPLYINTSPANTYAPDVFGWDLYTP